MLDNGVLVGCQGLDKTGKATTGLCTKHARALGVKTRELIFTMKVVGKLYKVTFAFESRQRVARFIGGTS